MAPWTPPSWCEVPARSEAAPLRRLVFTSPDQQGREVALSEKAFYHVGRGDGLHGKKPDVVLETAKVRTGAPSRWHCVICHDADGNTFVIDSESANGTYLDGNRIENKDWHRWDEGKTLEFGQSHGFECVLMLRETVSAIPRGLKRPLEESKPRSEAEERPSRDSGTVAEDEADKPGEEYPQPKRRQASGCGPSSGANQPMIGPELPPGFLKKKVPDPAPAPKIQSGAAGGPAGGAKAKAKTCDKCDGPHPTEQCPHFKKGRDSHKDAWANYGKTGLQIGSAGGNYVLRGARFVRQPGDGSCLYHSMCYGLKTARIHSQPSTLRQELATFIARNPNLEISGDTLEEWVRWDANTTCMSYARRMAVQGWGGGIEMAVCSLVKKVNVHVYERKGHNEFRRISCFDDPSGHAKGTVHVLYQGGVHYDALVPP